MSLVMDASAAVALHFLDERLGFESMEERLANGEEAFTAPNFFQEVMEALRRAIREGRTRAEDVAAWLTVVDSYSSVIRQWPGLTPFRILTMGRRFLCSCKPSPIAL